MKIALFTETYDNIDGVVTTIRHLEEYLKRRNHKLVVVTHEGQEGLHDGDAKVFRLTPNVPFNLTRGYPIDLLPPFLRAEEIAEREKPDIIHAISPGSAGLCGLYCAKRLGIPIVGSFHTHVAQYGRYHMKKYISDAAGEGFALTFDHAVGPLFEKLVWEGHFLFYSSCDRVLVPHGFKDMFEKKLKRGVEIFERGVDTDFFNPKKRIDLKRELGARKEVLLLYVGRIVVEKDLDILAEAQKKIDAHLVFVGDGLYLPFLKERIREDVSFLGFVSHERLATIYASCDIFIFPSTTDTIGNVVLEAQASGLPVLVSDRGGPKNIMSQGRTGFICEARNPADLADKASMLVENEGLRKAMGREARAYALTKRWEHVFDRLISTYEGLL